MKFINYISILIFTIAFSSFGNTQTDYKIELIEDSLFILYNEYYNAFTGSYVMKDSTIHLNIDGRFVVDNTNITYDSIIKNNKIQIDLTIIDYFNIDWYCYENTNFTILKFK